ncbi:DUF3000 domain-containing protein [Pseudonocardia sp.]|uniref:DUF3000 domain-containing protein n=1 Tax=Pseudonocardia sp. TaxID=60912 RepID=UPI00261B7C5C|nr:DUF3000 domain-containing protein [Pseudonocardia sp.]
MPDVTAAPPPDFRRAVDSIGTLRPRPELIVSALDAPPRLAPWTWAFSVEVADSTLGREAADDGVDESDTSGRLILLHDPAGQDAWEGTFRLVCFVQARLEPEQLGDEMLPVVGWSWLTEALEDHHAEHVALGGTVTQTSSVRFGDIARTAGGARGGTVGPVREDDVELRASWTPVGTDLSRHAEAFCAFVASAAGLPPVGAVPLAHRTV